MEHTVVTFHEVNFVVLTKGAKRAVIYMDEDVVMIVDPDVSIGSVPFVANVYHAKDSTEAYDKMMRWVGKLCKKSADSKYFLNHKLEEHLTNGNNKPWKKAKYIEMAAHVRNYLQEAENGYGE